MLCDIYICANNPITTVFIEHHSLIHHVVPEEIRTELGSLSRFITRDISDNTAIVIKIKQRGYYVGDIGVNLEEHELANKA
ncbi:MAG: hypothetical protein IH859_00465 [Chloroflexi bacterium]|nr:hypothetical protein [Chloroflexota bacterium]